MNYKKAYIKLFNHLTDLTQELMVFQQEAEELVIGDDEDLVPEDDDGLPEEEAWAELPETQEVVQI